MNILPDNVIDIIYKYKHDLEYNNVMNELIQTRINCRYLFSLNCVGTVRYSTHERALKACIDLNNLHIDSSWQLLFALRL